MIIKKFMTYIASTIILIKWDQNKMTLRVAVVDDREEFNEIVEEMALSLGFVVSTFTSGHLFIQFHEKEPFNIIILDIIMPNMDGLEVLQKLAAHSTKIDVILCSGYDPKYLDIAKTLIDNSEINVLATLQKPVRLRTIEKFLTSAQKDHTK